MLIEVIHVQLWERNIQFRLAMCGYGLTGNFDPQGASLAPGVLPACARKIALARNGIQTYVFNLRI
jgi:hypothetical protein